MWTFTYEFTRLIFLWLKLTQLRMPVFFILNKTPKITVEVDHSSNKKTICTTFHEPLPN